MGVNSRLRIIFGKSSVVVVAVGLVLLIAGSAFAASGVGPLVTGGENGAATAHSAQAPVGVVSAGVQSDVHTKQPPTPPSSGVKSDVQTSAPKNASSTARASATPARAAVPAASGAGQLPFTGFLAIPLLLIGAALLLIGFVVRRSTPGSA